MEEPDLPVDAFAKLDDLDRGLRQMGFDEIHLEAIGRRLKTEPYLQAVKVLSDGYAADWLTCPVNEHLTNVMDVWKEQGYLEEDGYSSVFHPTDKLLDDLQGAYDDGLLMATSSTRFGGSNSMVVAAAAAYLLMNPDIATNVMDVRKEQGYLEEDGFSSVFHPTHKLLAGG